MYGRGAVYGLNINELSNDEAKDCTVKALTAAGASTLPTTKDNLDAATMVTNV